MIDQRFSPQAFARLGPESLEAEELAGALARELAGEMHQAIDAVIRRAVEQLRLLGHDLREREVGGCRHAYGPSEPLPPEGWLALFIDPLVSAAFLGTQSEPSLEEKAVELAEDETVPFRNKSVGGTSLPNVP